MAVWQRREPHAREWIAAWPAGAVIGVANGVLRQATFARRFDERAAHRLSSATAIVLFAALFRWLQRRWPLRDGADARRAGLAWAVLTICFEFAFGRLVARLSWRELLADYDLAHGRTWPLVVAWLAAGPEVTRSLAART